MSHDKTLTGRGMALRGLGAVALVLLAGGLGSLLGRWTAPNILPQQVAEVNTEVPESDEATETLARMPVFPTQPPPLYLHLGIGPESVWEAIEQEITYAAETGLHRYIVPVALSWDESDDTTERLTHLERILALDPKAEFLLQLSFNPSNAWFEAHPDARMTGVAGDISLPTPASLEWLDASKRAFDQLHEQLQSEGRITTILGYVLQGLRQNRWEGGESLDDSPANLAGFRAWLRRNYADDDELRKAWHQDKVTLDSAPLPTLPPKEEGASAFLDLKEDAATIDYARYRATSVAEGIGALASHVRSAAGESPRIWAAYGYTFEMADAARGHLALGALLDSDVDGFMAPVSLANRGIGGTGGYMGPIDSAIAHGKEWLIIDDTRTGIAWNNETKAVDQMRGLRPEDVYNVQRRNFALAAVNGLALAWSDPDGRGALCSDAQWALIGGLRNIYRDQVKYPGSRLEIAWQTYPEDAPWEEDPTLLVVVDEAAQFLCNDGAGLAQTLTHNRDEILRTGVSTEFCLLDDLLDNRAPRADIYLFLNAYSLPSTKRKLLHQRFAEEEATAIWVYAPGYRDVTLTAANISDTVGMAVKAFKEPSVTGSVYALGGGRWLDENESIGHARAITPLFYVEDDEADVLAHYKQSEKPSVAMRTMEEGWTSIYLAEPDLSAALLREIFRILEQQVYFRPGKQRFFDLSVVRHNLLAIHGGQMGERIVNLGQFYDIQDLFDEKIGWPQKESFVLNLEAGETRLLQLSPL